MEMTGEYRIPARRDAVWRALSDPEVLRACIPGCETLSRPAKDAISATIAAKVGPIQAHFVVRLAFAHVQPPERCTIRGEAKGGVAGFATGRADLELAGDGDATILTYDASGDVGGKLAQLGTRLIDSTTKKIADAFVGAIANRLSGDEPTMASLTPTTPPDAEPVKPAPANLEPADAAATDELTDRIEHKIDDEALDLGEVAEEIEEEVEVAAARGFLGGPYVWGLLALIVVILFLAVVSR
ncbi:carbon monoxide dehydrogenase subunit G [Kaistia defluvii]|uniref:CoxG family protein n=1 Tax=Kaistia defluvii TaxID=410841 RepID=UPI0022525C14|nr:carbon monoxide dehydrogenase subunit G [Kaistia defluvii]MCX5520727.1 carbon monoxide dehydrogenase subunit G [Kaistia defluvii]